jgi:hypothetical protein
MGLYSKAKQSYHVHGGTPCMSDGRSCQDQHAYIRFIDKEGEAVVTKLAVDANMHLGILSLCCLLGSHHARILIITKWP